MIEDPKELAVTTEIDGCNIHGHFVLIERWTFSVVLDSMPWLSSGRSVSCLCRVGIPPYIRGGIITPRCRELARGSIVHLHEIEKVLSHHATEMLESYFDLKHQVEFETEYSQRLSDEDFRELRNPIRAQLRKGLITHKDYQAALIPLKKRRALSFSIGYETIHQVERVWGERFGVHLHYGDVKAIITHLLGHPSPEFTDE
jgi:hypothetical protein